MPTSAADVTPEFLTAAFRSDHLGTLVTACRCEFLDDERGLSGAVLIRVHLEGHGTSLPATVIVKLPPANDAVRAEWNAMGFFEREVNFYQSLSYLTPVSAPICYAAAFEPSTGRAFLVLEDLVHLRNGSSVVGNTIDEVEALLTALARMHARWWEDQKLPEQPWLRLSSMLAPSAVTDVFEQGWPQFLSRLSIPVDDELLAVKPWITETLSKAAMTLFETGPRTLIHNDVQGDNLFFSDKPVRPLVFIDWQLTTFARGVVDVANAIRGSFEPQVRRLVESDLLRGYHEALMLGGVRDYSLEQCQADYDLATVLAPARLASAVGMIPGLTAHPGAAWDTLFPRLMPDRDQT